MHHRGTRLCLVSYARRGRVVSGQGIETSWGPTRNEEDALAHLQYLIKSDPHATKWHLVLDNLNIHQSESLVRWIAEREEIDQEARMV